MGLSTLCGESCTKLNRRKTLEAGVTSTPLERCLTVLDVTLMGISYMIGPGIYVATGTVVQSEAGPGATVSYVIAGVAAILASLCYAEFGARIPLAGSAYTYTYVTMGEFWAFVVGWNMILEYIIGVATSAKAFSDTVDTTCGGVISTTLTGLFGITKYNWLNPYPDFVAVLSIAVSMALAAGGTKISVRFNNILSIFVVLSILLLVGLGFSLADFELWTSDKSGGFLPFGTAGVFRGAATCFFSYIGFDGIAVAGEEAINPQKALPWATFISMLTVSTMYVLTTAVLTLMVPYADIYVDAPFPVAFSQLGVEWAKYVVAVGSMVGMATSISGGMYILPRIAYAMASDGLLPPVFSRVDDKTQTPVLGVLILGSFACLLAMMVELDALILLMPIGTLISFSFVAASVVVARYRVGPVKEEQHHDAVPELTKSQITSHDCDTEVQEQNKTDIDKSPIPLQGLDADRLHDSIVIPGCYCFGLGQRLLQSTLYKTIGQERSAIGLLVTLIFEMILMALLLVYGVGSAAEVTDWWIVLFALILLSGTISCVILLHMLPQQTFPSTFCVPLVPLLPLVSMFFNICIMVMLDSAVWIRLVVWMAIGILFYFCYGLRHSRENKVLTLGAQVSTYGTLGETEKDASIQNSKEASIEPHP